MTRGYRLSTVVEGEAFVTLRLSSVTFVTLIVDLPL